MKRAARVVVVGIVLVLLVGVAARWIWHKRVDTLFGQLDTRRAAVETAPSAQPVPPPVARYLVRSNPGSRAPITAVNLDTAGEFFMSPESGWKPFHARQRFNAITPGFVWDARIAMSPLMPVFVRDAYVDGRGEMVARLLAVYAVANESGGDGLAEGQLTRYVAEMIWFPTALAPGRGVIWTPVDDHTATASFSDHGHAIALRFTFNDANDVVGVFAPARMRAVDGRQVPTPWAVRCWDHEERLGFRIPLACEAEWRVEGAALPYWRGRVTNIRFE